MKFSSSGCLPISSRRELLVEVQNSDQQHVEPVMETSSSPSIINGNKNLQRKKDTAVQSLSHSRSHIQLVTAASPAQHRRLHLLGVETKSSFMHQSIGISTLQNNSSNEISTPIQIAGEDKKPQANSVKLPSKKLVPPTDEHHESTQTVLYYLPSMTPRLSKPSLFDTTVVGGSQRRIPQISNQTKAQVRHLLSQTQQVDVLRNGGQADSLRNGGQAGSAATSFNGSALQISRDSAQFMGAPTGQVPVMRRTVFPSAHVWGAKRKKPDRSDILLMIKYLKDTYKPFEPPDERQCATALRLLRCIEKQDNVYGPDMRVLFAIIDQLIFCQDKSLLDVVMKGREHDKKQKDVREASLNAHLEDDSEEEKLRNPEDISYARVCNLLRGETQAAQKRLKREQATVQELQKQLASVQERLAQVQAQNENDIRARLAEQTEELTRLRARCEDYKKIVRHLNDKVNVKEENYLHIKNQFVIAQYKLNNLEEQFKTAKNRQKVMQEYSGEYVSTIDQQLREIEVLARQLEEAKSKKNHYKMRIRDLTPRLRTEGQKYEKVYQFLELEPKFLESLDSSQARYNVLCEKMLAKIEKIRQAEQSLAAENNGRKQSSSSPGKRRSSYSVKVQMSPEVLRTERKNRKVLNRLKEIDKWLNSQNNNLLNKQNASEKNGQSFANNSSMQYGQSPSIGTSTPDASSIDVSSAAAVEKFLTDLKVQLLEVGKLQGTSTMDYVQEISPIAQEGDRSIDRNSHDQSLSSISSEEIEEDD